MTRSTRSLAKLNERIVACERCPRLRHYCEKVAQQKRAAYRDWTYWGKPVPNFLPAVAYGTSRPENARLLLVGLAPAAHGANRTGRMFTGDKSGDFLYRALYETGLANQPEATDANDGLALNEIVITAALHCAPPANKPRGEELHNCRLHLERTFDALPDLRGVITLGKVGHDAVLRLYKQRDWIDALANHPFAHGRLHEFDHPETPPILSSYHPSQQNTFTGRLTPAMLREVFQRARHWLV